MPPSVEQKSIPTIEFTNDFSESWDRGVDFWVKSMIDTGKLNKSVRQAYDRDQLEKEIYNLELYTRARSHLK